MMKKYSMEYKSNKLSGDWTRLNNPLLGFPDMYIMIINNYRVLKK
jgi:hypothetical protein